MAGKKINGITIAINADTKGVTSGLKEITSQSVKVSSELKDVERLLKLNPSNVELTAQKQQLLSNQIENTSQKLAALKGAQEDVQKAFEAGEIGEEQYRAFQREIAATEGALNGYSGKLDSVAGAQDRLAQNTSRLETLFSATGTSVEDFRDILGNRLTDAIKNGTASADDLETALNKIGRASLGNEADIGKLKEVLDSLDDGESVENVRKEIEKMGGASDDASQKVSKLTEIAGSQLMMDVADKAAAAADKVREIGQAGVEAAATMKASEAQFSQVFGDMEDQAHSIVETMAEDMGILPKRLEPGYAAISSQLMSLGVDQQSAMKLAEQALTSSADAAAFYDLSLENAQERVQSFIKGNLSAAESIGIFATANGLNEYAIQKAGTAANAASKEYQDMTEAEKQNLRIDYINEMQEKAKVTGQAAREMDGYENVMGNLNSVTEEFMAAIGDEALQSFVNIAQMMIPIIKDIVDWFKGLNPAIKQFITLLGTVLVAVGAILPIIASLGAAAAVAGTTIGGLIVGTILPAIAIIAGLVAAVTAVILVIKNWGAISDWLKEKWQDFKTWIVKLWESLKQSAADIFDKLGKTFKDLWESIKRTAEDIWQGIADFFTGIWEGITGTISDAWNGIKDFFTGIWKSITETMKKAWENIVNTLKPIVEAIYNVIMVPISLIQTAIEAVWLLIKAGITIAWEAIKIALSAIWQGIVDTATAIFTPIIDFISGVWSTVSQKAIEAWQAIAAFLSEIWTGVTETAATVWNGLNEFLTGVWNGIAETASSIFTSIKETVTGIWQAITDVVGGIVDGLKEKIGSVFDAIKDRVAGVVEKIKEIIQGLADKFTEIKDSIKGVIDSIAKAIGNIKLPHFSLKTSSKTILGKEITYPSGIDVKWFAEGGILTKPTIFGAAGGKLLGGGEAGPEAIAPIDKLQDYVRAAVQDVTGQGGGNEYHIHLNAYGDLPKDVMDAMAEYLLYKFTELEKEKNPFGEGAI